jgi:hypothetical protein
MNILRDDPKKFDDFKKFKHSMMDERGREIPNPQPKFKIIGRRPDTLEEQIERCINRRMARQVVPVPDNPEEADDFSEDEIDEDMTPYTLLEEEFVDEPPILPQDPPPDNPTKEVKTDKKEPPEKNEPEEN